jgi:hypothetical protein
LSLFSTALSNYSSWIDRYATLPVADAPGALPGALDALADAVAVVPRAEDLAPRQVAAEMRELAVQFATAPALSPRQASLARQVFERANAILSLVKHKYPETPEVAYDVRALHDQYVTIDPSQPLQPHSVLGALEAVERVLRTIGMAYSSASVSSSG